MAATLYPYATVRARRGQVPRKAMLLSVPEGRHRLAGRGCAFGSRQRRGPRRGRRRRADAARPRCRARRRRALGRTLDKTLRAAVVPDGYTVTIWATGAYLIRDQTDPGAVFAHALMFIFGALLAFALLACAPTAAPCPRRPGPGRATADPPRFVAPDPALGPAHRRGGDRLRRGRPGQGRLRRARLVPDAVHGHRPLSGAFEPRARDGDRDAPPSRRTLAADGRRLRRLGVRSSACLRQSARRSPKTPLCDAAHTAPRTRLP